MTQRWRRRTTERLAPRDELAARHRDVCTAASGGTT
jgi:hypothetical protein